MKRRNRIRPGFTLVELLVVITIIAILAAMLLPANARMSFWVQDGTWLGLDYHLTATEKALLNEQYFPRLKKQSQTSASDQRSFK